MVNGDGFQSKGSLLSEELLEKRIDAIDRAIDIIREWIEGYLSDKRYCEELYSRIIRVDIEINSRRATIRSLLRNPDDFNSMCRRFAEEWWREPERQRRYTYLSWRCLMNILDYVTARSLSSSIAGVVGDFGLGKTTLTTHAMLGVLDVLFEGTDLFPKREDVFMGLIVWDIKELLHLVTRIDEERLVVPFIIYDDAGIHFPKYWMQTETSEYKKLLSLLFRYFMTIKDLCSLFVITSPDSQDVAKWLRDHVTVYLHGSIVGRYIPLRDSCGGTESTRWGYSKLHPPLITVLWDVMARVHFIEGDNRRRRRIRQVGSTLAHVYMEFTIKNMLKMPERIWELHQEIRRCVRRRLGEFTKTILPKIFSIEVRK